MRIAGPSPFGLGHQKPHHYSEMLRVFWENRDNLPYAWRILNHGSATAARSGRAAFTTTRSTASISA
jgi:hypothetical protein